MRPKECDLVQELLPLYAEELVAAETAQYIEEHLASCNSCAREWESFATPLPDPLTAEVTPEKHIEHKLIGRIRRTVALAALVVVLGGAGLAYASFTAGRHIGISDPVYRFAQELNLFTEIEQTKTLNGVEVSLDRGLFDSTRSVLFISLSSPATIMPQVSLLDQNGAQYDQRRGKGWNDKYFMLEFEPVGLDTTELSLSLALDEAADSQAEFIFPVDVVKTAQYTKIIYPNQKVELDDLKIALDKVVLGVSEAEYNLRFDWPTDGSVAGLGIGIGDAYFPTSVTKISSTAPPPGIGALPPEGLVSDYAATSQINYRSEDLPDNRPVLYDLTERKEVEALSAEYRTTQFPCQVEATLNFAPVSQSSEKLELLLPTVYLYTKTEGIPEIHFDFKEKDEINLVKHLSTPQGEIVIEKAWLEDNVLYLNYSMSPSDESDHLLPHFQLKDHQGQKQGQMYFERDNPQIITFYLFDEGAKELVLQLDSVGQLLPRNKFVLDLEENK